MDSFLSCSKPGEALLSISFLFPALSGLEAAGSLKKTSSGCILKAMGDKDIAEKRLEAYNDVFADIVNVLLFDGRELVKEDALDDADRLSEYKASGSLHEQERDVAKFWHDDGAIRICLYGLENQTDVDIDIPLRVISYDGAAYRAQLLADKGEEGKKRRKPRFPVVTLVLYFGMERWNKPKSLLECLKIPEELKPYVSDYRVNVFEIAWLEPETVAKFRSDFRIVADYFVQLRRDRDYKPSAETIRHVHEVLQLMAVLTKDDRFKQVQLPPEAEGGMVMCEVLDRYINQGRATGRSEIQTLMKNLFSTGRVDDLRRASTDDEYLQKLLAEQHLLAEQGGAQEQLR